MGRKPTIHYHCHHRDYDRFAVLSTGENRKKTIASQLDVHDTESEGADSMTETTLIPDNQIIDGDDLRIILGVQDDSDVNRYLQQQEEKKSVSVELWLDLRDTAILPSAALSHLLENDLWDDETIINDDKVFYIDKVLTSFDNRPRNNNKSFSEWATQHMEEQFENLIEILYQSTSTKNEHLLYSATNDGGSASLGICVDLQSKEGRTTLLDPIPSLECISQGKWVVVNSDNISDEEQRKITIQSLVEVLASSSSFSSFLLQDNEKDDDTVHITSTSSMGGVAISCKTNSDIVHTGALIQSLSSGVTSTDSGILLPSTDFKNNQSIKFAVLLPLDIMLWKTASFVLGYSTITNDEK